MATLLSFHAHPDDEAIGTGGVIAKAAAQGHRVVIVIATRGEHGLVPDGIDGAGKPLADLRTQEAHRSAEALGASRVAFLDYIDSGMKGDELNNHPECFWQCDIDEAGERLAMIIREEKPDVITYYDENGVYGHPDHVQVNRVGVRAVELAPVPHVFMSTVDRERAFESFQQLKESGLPIPGRLDEGEFILGVPSERITTVVNVVEYMPQKREAMKAHASQIAESSFFLGLPDDMARQMWGQENFMKVGAPTGYKSDDLFADVS